MIESSIFGGLLGGLFRLAPEVLKWMDRKDERKHELDMLDKEMAYANIKATSQAHTENAMVDTAQLDSIGEALKGQAEMAVAGGKRVAAISALVRPMITYWVVTLWSFVKIASIMMAIHSEGNWAEVLVKSWNADDVGILSMILMFWFVGRAMEKK